MGKHPVRPSWKRRRVLGAAGTVVIGTSLAPLAQRSKAATTRVEPLLANIDRVAGKVGPNVTAFSGDGGPASEAGFGHPQALAVTRGGDTYLAEVVSGAKPYSTATLVRRIDARSGRIDTVAGTGRSGYSFVSPGRWVRTGDPNPSNPNPRSAYLGAVMGLAVDNSDNPIITSSDPAGYGFIRRLDMRSGKLILLAGSSAGDGGDRQPAVNTLLFGPIGLVLDQGALIVAEFGNHRVRRIDLTTGLITTLVGTGRTFRSQRKVADPVKGQAIEFSVTDVGDGGAATDAVVFNPWGLAMDSARNLFVTEYGGHRVRRIDAQGKITTVAGTGVPGFSGDGRSAKSARLNHPKGIAVDAAGNIFVADSENARIRMITPDGSIATLAGTGRAGYSGDGGRALAAQLATPNAISLTPSGSLLIADEGNRLIRSISFS